MISNRLTPFAGTNGVRLTSAPTPGLVYPSGVYTGNTSGYVIPPAGGPGVVPYITPTRGVPTTVGSGAGAGGSAVTAAQTGGGSAGLQDVGTAGGRPAAAIGNPDMNLPGGFSAYGWEKNMGYTPADVLGHNNMPAMYLRDMIAKRGLDPGGGLFYMMEPLADSLPALYGNLVVGNQPLVNGQAALDPYQQANWMGSFWANMMTPGGSMPNINQYVSNLLNANDPRSVLGNALNVGSPEEQIQNMQQAMQTAYAFAGANPFYKQAMQNYLSRAGYAYLSGFEGGNQPGTTFGQYLQQPGAVTYFNR